jgi:hypothetical protein
VHTAVGGGAITAMTAREVIVTLIFPSQISIACFPSRMATYFLWLNSCRVAEPELTIVILFSSDVLHFDATQLNMTPIYHVDFAFFAI